MCLLPKKEEQHEEDTKDTKWGEKDETAGNSNWRWRWIHTPFKTMYIVATTFRVLLHYKCHVMYLFRRLHVWTKRFFYIDIQTAQAWLDFVSRPPYLLPTYCYYLSSEQKQKERILLFPWDQLGNRRWLAADKAWHRVARECVIYVVAGIPYMLSLSRTLS